MVDQPMFVDPNLWVRVEPSSTAPKGALDAVRWRELNKFLGLRGNDHEGAIEWYCRRFQISRQTVEGMLATYRHDSPLCWQ